MKGKGAGSGAPEVRVFTAIPFAPDFGKFSARVRLGDQADCRRQARELFDAAAALLRPKGLYLDATVTRREGPRVRLGETRFESRLLGDLLTEGQRVFPYLATCGGEADALDLPDDLLARFWLDTLKQTALTAALEHLRARVAAAYPAEHLASMNPGSGEADLWPLEQQGELFSLFAGGEARIGVRLTDSFLMVPNKSVSGLFFAAAEGFETCRLCFRPNCRHRRAPAESAV